MKKKNYVILIVILAVILISILVPIRNEGVTHVDYKNNKTVTTRYRAYYNIYGMRIYKVVIDYSED